MRLLARAHLDGKYPSATILRMHSQVKTAEETDPTQSTKYCKKMKKGK